MRQRPILPRFDREKSRAQAETEKLLEETITLRRTGIKFLFEIFFFPFFAGMAVLAGMLSILKALLS